MADRELIAAILTAGMLPTLEITRSRLQARSNRVTAASRRHLADRTGTRFSAPGALHTVRSCTSSLPHRISRNAAGSSPFQDWLRSRQERSMAQEYRPGDIVPQSGIYTITHDPVHTEMPHEVTAIKGHRFPTCRHCRGSVFSSLMRQSMCRKSSISKNRRLRPCKSRTVPNEQPAWRN
jgi:hypothetical protein